MEKRDVLREAPHRVLDIDARKRRLRKALEILEQDNHIEENQTESKATKKPRFEDVSYFRNCLKRFVVLIFQG